MNNETSMDEGTDTLPTEDIGVLLANKAERLQSGDGDEDEILRDILETLGRAENIRIREKPVGQSGRVSVGRDMGKKTGVTLFQPDERLDGGDE